MRAIFLGAAAVATQPEPLGYCSRLEHDSSIPVLTGFTLASWTPRDERYARRE